MRASSPSERLTNLDIIRGLMILWMLVDHISLNYGYIKFGDTTPGVSAFTLMSFFMTPFYVFSGYLFSSKREFKAYTINKIRKLLVPYLFFSLFGIMVYELYSLYTQYALDFNFIWSFIPTATFNTNTPCWFFISLFFVSELYYLISKLEIKWGGQFLRIIIVICFLLAFITRNHSQYFGYGNVLLGLVYFHMGQELKKYQDFIFKHQLFVFSVALLSFMTIGVFYTTSLSFVLNLLTRGNYLTNLTFSVSACLLLWILTCKFDHTQVGKSIAYVGRISLVVFAFHRPVLNWILQPTIMNFYPSISYFIFLLICLIVILLLSIAIEKLLTTYAPKFIGK